MRGAIVTLTSSILTLFAVCLLCQSANDQIAAWQRRLQTGSHEERMQTMAAIRLRAYPTYPHPTEPCEATALFPLLRTALSNTDEFVRAQAVSTATRLRCRDSVAFVDECLSHPDETVRYNAVLQQRSLSHVEGMFLHAVTNLRRLRDRQDESDSIRLLAACELLELGEAQPHTIFVDALRKPKANHAIAGRALATLERKEAIELMINCLEAAAPDLDYWLAKALAQLTGIDLGADHRKWRSWLELHRSDLPRQLK